MSISINQAFGRILAAYRKLEGLSQEDFEGAAHRTYVSDLERGLKSPTLETIAKLAAKLKVHPTELVARTLALLETGQEEFAASSVSYLRNTSANADFSYMATGRRFTAEEVEQAVALTNITIVTLTLIFRQVSGADLFEVIDKKQTGAFIGSIFVSNFATIAASHLAKNPSQTGHPDLIPKEYLNDESIANWDRFSHGGVEVKTSCGSLRQGVAQSLAIGETRLPHLSGVEWKGHHQEINYLLGLFWDYFEDNPTILAAFYSNRLVPDDFTYTIPKKGGGRTTSVCVTKASARKKLMRNWVLLPNIAGYQDFFKKLGATID
ncbi:MAG: helix-turn-helix transcriptional regulator [Oscillatoria sp. SIO1A7]|nr:helix-turn-helix transcriptional regulator [Oscillatoria sp. SIO1A7]